MEVFHSKTTEISCPIVVDLLESSCFSLSALCLLRFRSVYRSFSVNGQRKTQKNNRALNISTILVALQCL